MAYKSLEEENKALKQQLAKYENRNKDRIKLGVKATKYLSTKILGSKLKASINILLTELEEKKTVSKDTLSELFTAIFVRITRIGFFLVLTTIVPTLLIFLQVYYLKNSNQLIRSQNNRLDQQTYLQEASRRSFMIGVLDEIMKDINKKGTTVYKTDFARLNAISKNLKPYRYLDNDHLTNKPSSPERGYLVLSLIESELKLSAKLKESHGPILSAIDFDYAELRDINLKRKEINNLTIKHGILDGSDLTKANFAGCTFENSSFLNTRFNSSDILRTTFENSTLKNTNFSNAFIQKCSFNNTVLENTNFSNTDVRNVSFKGAKLINTNFNNTEVSPNWMKKMKTELNDADYSYLEENYQLKINGKRAIMIRK